MARTPPEPTGSDPALIEHFIRVFGHSPTAPELERYRRARLRLLLRQPRRRRRRAARIVIRL